MSQCSGWGYSTTSMSWNMAHKLGDRMARHTHTLAAWMARKGQTQRATGDHGTLSQHSAGNTPASRGDGNSSLSKQPAQYRAGIQRHALLLGHLSKAYCGCLSLQETKASSIEQLRGESIAFQPSELWKPDQIHAVQASDLLHEQFPVTAGIFVCGTFQVAGTAWQALQEKWW